jgi:hypothetical protein
MKIVIAPGRVPWNMAFRFGLLLLAACSDEYCKVTHVGIAFPQKLSVSALVTLDIRVRPPFTMTCPVENERFDGATGRCGADGVAVRVVGLKPDDVNEVSVSADDSAGHKIFQKTGRITTTGKYDPDGTPGVCFAGAE